MLIGLPDIFGIKEDFMKSFYYVCISLDKGMYNIVAWVYNTLLDIAGYELVSPEVVDVITRRMFVVASVVMLFVVAYSLLRGIINPDELSGSGNYSGKKVAFGILKSLVAVIIIPACFDLAYSLQASILKENVIGNIILGSGNSVTSFDYDPGLDFSLNLYHAFLYDDEYTLPEESLNSFDIVDENGNPMVVYDSAENVFRNSRNRGRWSCDGDMPCVLSSSTTGHIYDGEYEYLPVVGFLTGIFAVVILIMYLFDISLRAVKLVFLEIISPIPSFMQIIPTQTKVFSSWLKETLKTFADLFVRLAILYFSIFVIQQIFAKNDLLIGTGYTNRNVVKLFLVFGVLMFMAKAPKLITTIFGIDTGYGFSFKKRWDDVKSGFKTLSTPISNFGRGISKGAGAIAGVGLAKKAYNEGRNMGIKPKNKRDDILRRTWAGINGARNGFNGGLKNMGSAYNYELENQRAYANNPNGTVRSAIADQLRDNFGFDSRYDYLVRQEEIQRDLEVAPLRNKLGKYKKASYDAIQNIEKKYKQPIEDNKKGYDFAKELDDTIESDLNKSTSNRMAKINLKNSMSYYYDEAKEKYKEKVKIGSVDYYDCSYKDLQSKYEGFKQNYADGKINKEFFDKQSKLFEDRLSSMKINMETYAKSCYDKDATECNWYDLQAKKELVNREGKENYPKDIFDQIDAAEKAIKLEYYNELQTGKKAKAEYKNVSDASKSKFIILQNYIANQDNSVGVTDNTVSNVVKESARTELLNMVNSNGIVDVKKKLGSLYEQSTSLRETSLNTTVVSLDGENKTLASVQYETDVMENQVSERNKKTEKVRESYESEKNRANAFKSRRDNRPKYKSGKKS